MMTDPLLLRLLSDPKPARIVTDRARYWNTAELLFRLRGRPSGGTITIEHLEG